MNGTPSTVTAPPKAVNVIVTDDTLTVDLEDGRTISVPIGWFARLAYRSPDERANFQISVPVAAFTGLILTKILA
jgi:hypothetical protein